MSMYNGWTPPIPQETRIKNLLAAIPQEHRSRASRECYGQDDNEFERNLIAYVLFEKWNLPESAEQPHPAETAYQLEKAMEGTYPSPIISGGEVQELGAVESGISDDDMPF